MGSPEQIIAYDKLYDKIIARQAALAKGAGDGKQIHFSAAKLENETVRALAGRLGDKDSAAMLSHFDSGGTFATLPPNIRGTLDISDADFEIKKAEFLDSQIKSDTFIAGKSEATAREHLARMTAPEGLVTLSTKAEFDAVPFSKAAADKALAQRFADKETIQEHVGFAEGRAEANKIATQNVGMEDALKRIDGLAYASDTQKTDLRKQLNQAFEKNTERLDGEINKIVADPSSGNLVTLRREIASIELADTKTLLAKIDELLKQEPGRLRQIEEEEAAQAQIDIQALEAGAQQQNVLAGFPGTPNSTASLP